MSVNKNIRLGVFDFWNTKCLIILILLSILFASCDNKAVFVIENDAISRTVKIVDGKLFTSEIVNKKAGKSLLPLDAQEFKVRISEGTHLEGTDQVLSSEDFTFDKTLETTSTTMGFLLKNKEHGLDVEVHYELNSGAVYARKYLNIKSKKNVTIERVDIEVINLTDISQPYNIKQITAQGPAKWRPGLGQPLYTTESATFWGVEFPAAYNYVEGKQGYCGYQWGREVKAGETYTSYNAVVGVGDDAEFIQDAFFNYIDEIRVRPLRLQIQYNSWFDFGNGVTKEIFSESVSTINQKLVEERNVPPLRAYVIDDGWEDVHADWSNKTWKVNNKFDKDFSTSMMNVRKAKSNLGLWLSPGCLLGAQPAAKKYKEQGFETMGNWMSMAGPKYMQLLEDRILELTKDGVTYFKLDGVFGHLNIREFELNGQKYGIPYMPQLGTAGLSASDSLLNDPKFDELKTYYLVAGTERLMALFAKQHQVNPDVYVVISNGAYLSPWWLMYIDAVWMINAGDAAGGSNRTQELVYRDGVYFDTWQKEKTQYPINSVFNHEPKKVKTGESKQAFSEYLWMNLSRGTGFIELYVKTQKLSEDDWDVLADGLKWAHEIFPYFKRSRMHGGDPNLGEVYGYSGWNESGGYASFHNPSNQAQNYVVTLDRKFGLIPVGKTYKVSSPLNNADMLSGKSFKEGSQFEISLEPGQVKILNFN